MTLPPVRTVIADDHPALRAGVRAVLEATGQIEVVGEAAGGEEALRLCRQLTPNVLLLDVEMPGGLDGVEVASRIGAESPSTRVLAFSAYDDRAYVASMLQAGAAGYITKDKPLMLVAEAVQAVARGEGRWFVTLHKPDDELPLSEREFEVLRLMARGRSNDEIGQILSISPHTVRNHISSVYAKLEVGTWREAVAWAWERGLVGS
jgi:DNA-binding NarL/FixJ family response regulator